MQKKIVKVLASTLYEVITNKVSVDVAFKRACRGKCASSLNERERLYNLARSVVSEYIKITCVLGVKKPYSRVVRAWLKGVDDEDLPPWCRLSFNEWFYRKIVNLLGHEEGTAVLRAMNRRVWWLRINTLKASPYTVLKELEEEGVRYEVDPHIPYVIRVLESRKPIRLLRPVKEFKAVPQDKASAAVVEALNPQPGDLILDMSFAPGMKTSLIQMLAGNRAKVVAVDISYRRVLSGVRLLNRLGVEMATTQVINADSMQKFIRNAVFDKVLLDAPCSNSGAISKDPGIKINLTEGKINYYSSVQRSLLRQALELGNEVVYSTCSLMPEEGEFIVSEIYNLVNLERPIKWAGPGYGVVPFKDEVMRLFPHTHLTEGFFIAKIRPR